MELAKRWEALATEVSLHFQPPNVANSNFNNGSKLPPDPSNRGIRGGAGAGPIAWSCDVFILVLEHCPTGKARRMLLCADGTCAALWKASLSQNLPNLARRLAVWIGLSLNSTVKE